jgi:hypothetical protein
MENNYTKAGVLLAEKDQKKYCNQNLLKKKRSVLILE